MTSTQRVDTSAHSVVADNVVGIPGGHTAIAEASVDTHASRLRRGA